MCRKKDKKSDGIDHLSNTWKKSGIMNLNDMIQKEESDDKGKIKKEEAEERE